MIDECVRDKLTDLLTVGIPFYRDVTAEQLSLAVDSILKQSVPAKTVQLLQDGEVSHELAELVEHYVATYPCIELITIPKRQGLAHALNESLKCTTTKYYARMDADDIAYHDRFEKQLLFLESAPEVDVLGSWAFEFTSIHGVESAHFLKRMPDTQAEIERYYHLRNPLVHPSVIFRMTVFDDVGYYDESLQTAQDLELWGRVLRQRRVIRNLQEPLLYFRTDNMIIRRSTWSAVRCQWRARGVIAASTWSVQLLKFMSVSFRLLPIRFIELGYRFLRG